MRKMKKHRAMGLFFPIFMCLFKYTLSQEHFEDADTLIDMSSSSSGQQFDLRHTIPGIPDVDYPIYSEVPQTSFECTGRHEGYYADVESRCQAFHICTHTAPTNQGFGFLCPNGTLFSQKHFVCDWYRNVNCDDSERYFNKNDANRVGSSLDMMERVRQMMEYPMKTISKALQQNQVLSKKPIKQRQRGPNRVTVQTSTDNVSQSETDTSSSNRQSSSRKSVTRDQIESAHNRGTMKFNKNKVTVSTDQVKTSAVHGEDIKSDTIAHNSDVSVSSTRTVENTDVYVNSLGELSTDPGVHFDRTNAHIIAEPRRYRYERRNNFAQKVNTALNDLTDQPANEKLAPDYVKSIRGTNRAESTQIDLASNINSLLDEVQNDLNPSVSGYQDQAPKKSKHSFRFLSRGFSSQNDPYKYQKPEQTASTIRFTPNQLPIDEQKVTKKPVFEIANGAAGFGSQLTTVIPETTTTTIEPPTSSEPQVYGDAENYLQPPISEDIPYLNPLLLPPVEDAVVESSTSTPINEPDYTTIIPEPEINTIVPTDLQDTPTHSALIDTTTTTAAPTEIFETEETTNIPDIAQNLVLSQQQQEEPNKKYNEDEEAPIDEERLDVNKQAESLFFSGLKLTTNDNNTEATTPETRTPLLIKVEEDHSYLTAWVTSTPVPPIMIKEEPATSTTEADTGSFKERIRNYRRLANLQRSTPKTPLYAKRGSSYKSTTSTTTTSKPLTTTRSYLKRIAASRLRLSRLKAAAGNRNNLSTKNVASISPENDALDVNENKKLSIRNIEKETAVAGNGLSESSSGKEQAIVTWESVKNSLQRFNIKQKKYKDNESQSVTANEEPSTSRSTAQITKNRYSNFKSPSSRNIENIEKISSSATPTLNKPATSTSVSMSVSSSSAGNNIALPLNFLNSFLPPTLSPTTSTLSFNSQTQQTITSTSTLSNADNTNLNSNSATSSNSPTSTFISFDKLTRSIVDDSILQNYRGGAILGRTSQTTFGNNQQSRKSNVFNSNVHQTSSTNGFNNQGVRSNQNFQKIPPLDPSQLTPPKRPAHLPAFGGSATAPTTPGPRIVIARAEGQRIEPNSVSSIISSLISQQQQRTPPKPSPTTSYVPLDDFLTKKFGNQQPTKATSVATAYYPQQQYQQPARQTQQTQHNQQAQQTRPSIAQQYQPQTQQHQLQQQHQHQRQHQQQQQQQQPNYYQTLSKPNNFPQQSSTINQYQISKQQLSPATPALQPLSTQNIFANFQQQQKQLPQFPPLATQAAAQQEVIQTQQPQFNGANNYLNVRLPSLPNGLIPAPVNQIAQKRSDVDIDNLDLSDQEPLRSVFSGATSYDVPLSSIGRLPNDITALLKRLRRY